MTSDQQKYDRVLRWLSWILRHAPASSDVPLDDEGWATLDRLAISAPIPANHWTTLTVDELRDVLASASPGRFEVRHDRIRARYGHSLRSVEVARAAMPPRELFHATAHRFVTQILQTGLQPMGRNRVHLTTDLDYARRIAEHHRIGLILAVDAAQAHRSGSVFFSTRTHVWQTASVAPQFLAVREIVTSELASDQSCRHRNTEP